MTESIFGIFLKQMLLPDYVKKIDLPTPYAVGAVSIYYFAKANTAIDIGPDQKSTAELLNEAGVKTDKLRILATHGHDDHIGIAKNRQFSRFFLNDADADWLMYKYPGNDIAEKNLLKLGLPPLYVQGILNVIERIFKKISVPVYEAINEGELFDLDGRTFITIGTAGHTPGSVSFFLKDEGILFSGDAVLADITSNPGTIFVVSVPVGKCNFNPIKNYLETLDKLESIAPVLIAGSHGKLVKNPKERIRELRKSYIERIEKTYYMLKTNPMTIFETARMIFRNHTADDDLILQLGEAMSYIYYLKNLNLIIRKGLKWYTV